MSEVIDRLTEVFRSTLGVEDLALNSSMTADDVAGWDLVSHISLIYAVEDEFAIKLSAKDIAGLHNVGDLVAAIERRS